MGYKRLLLLWDTPILGPQVPMACFLFISPLHVAFTLCSILKWHGNSSIYLAYLLHTLLPFSSLTVRIYLTSHLISSHSTSPDLYFSYPNQFNPTPPPYFYPYPTLERPYSTLIPILHPTFHSTLPQKADICNQSSCPPT
jgi:hypothetical protein